MSKLTKELRYIPQCVPIGPWRKVTDAAADHIDSLEARLAAAGVMVDVLNERMKAAEAVCEAAEDYICDVGVTRATTAIIEIRLKDWRSLSSKGGTP